MKLRLTVILFTLAVLAGDGDAASFITGGNALRSAVPGIIKSTPVLFCGELDGAVSCYTLEGKKLWRNPSQSPAVLFELAAVDVDNDGRDDLLSASGDGSITCWNANGTLRWRFRGDRKIRFNEVAVLKRGTDLTIFAGGNDRMVYALDRNGKLIDSHEFPGAIRKLEVGDFKKDGEPLLFVMSMKHDKSGWISFGFHDPDHLAKEVASLSPRKRTKRLSGIITDLRVTDLDRDGRDDLMVFINESPTMCVVNGDFEEIAGYDTSKAKDKELRRSKQRYAHTSGISVAPARDEILMQFGRTFYLLDDEGNLKDWSGDISARFPMSDFVYHPAVNRLFGIGSVAGDNGVYEFDLQKDDWWKDHVQPQGRIAEVNRNLETLYKQVVSFVPPAYQKPADKPWVMGYNGEIPDDIAKLKFNEVVMVKQQSWGEDYNRVPIVEAVGAEFGNKRDKRKKYSDTQEDLVRQAREFESEGMPFTVWAGHGSDPFYVSIDTLEAVLEAAPSTCYGFIYAEMANTKDPRIHYFIDQYMPRLAAACRKQGRAKLFFRYKQTFWATTVHMHPWCDLFLSGKYADVLAPATEDTNSTTQELNLSGRVGMFAGGYVNDFAMRLIDDNPTGWRPLAPGRQKTISPFLRSGVMRAAYGARYGVLWNFKGHDGPGLELLMGLMGSGVLPLAEADDLLSIGSWHLMDEIPYEIEERAHGLGHDISQYLESDYERVISCSEVHWGGASVPEYDFSKVLGVDYRWLNFMPELPYGMIPIAPVEYGKQLKQTGTPYVVSDSQSGFVDGQKIPAAQFGPAMLRSAQAGAGRMPVVVKGAAWSAIRLDQTHVRLILIDPGYLDPQERQVEIRFQHRQPVNVTDILTAETFSAEGDRVSLSVPAGSMRFIDLTY
ncbi:hypothetical protein [Pontiella agarivorans]|uniref:Lambda-carrageenase n=1 Tax=Pontiella agarivorans TaxID=3038953 RepID=A0ABU5MSD9_9BACT|nr:hypothetical protein [Pontiella agarivorans]MDZ8117048.1 hypothetical protein [Pontiella agarivorans]